MTNATKQQEPWGIHSSSAFGMDCKWLLFIFLISFSCKKQISYPETKIIGHAGTGLKSLNAIFHDNSKESVEMAMETSGCDGVEIDIQLSASGKLWLFHDPDLSVETKHSGCIGTKTDPELQDICYQSLHNEKLLPLNQLPFAKCKGKTVMLDLRHYNYCKGQIVDVQPFLDELSSISQFHDGSIEVLILLNSSAWLPYFETLPFPVIYSAGTIEEALPVMNSMNFDGLIIKNSEISGEQVSQLKSAGKKVIIFEVRSPKGIRNAFRKAPDYLVTDDLRATIIEKY